MPLAVIVGAVATPLPLVVAVAVVKPPVKVPLAPLAGAVNVTVRPLSRLLLASLTVAPRGVPKLVFTVALCEAPLVAVMLAGTGGGAADVVAKTELDAAEVLPDGSYADTVYVYDVDAARPVSEYDAPVLVPACTPLRRMLYPATALSGSVDAVQLRLI